jgi:hypothetical protein
MLSGFSRGLVLTLGESIDKGWLFSTATSEVTAYSHLPEAQATNL